MERRKRPTAEVTLFAVALVAAIASATACSRRGAADPSGATASVDCSNMKLAPEPDLVAWDAPSRAQLDKLRRQGVVAVRYEATGCEVSLELLPDCVGPKNKYVYVPKNSSDTKIAHDATELFSRIPIGATSLSSFVKPGRVVRSDEKIVGSVELPEGSTVSAIDLVGPECKRATHIVRAVWVGGFAMAHGDAPQVEGAQNLFSGERVGEPVVHEGYPQACERAGAEGVELDGCAVPLRVSLISLREEAEKTTCPGDQAWDGSKCTTKIAARDQVSSCAKGDDTCGGDTDGGTKRVFDQAAIERVIRAHQLGVRRTCWDASPSGVRRLTVAVSARVDPEGHVTDVDANVQDLDGPADVASAVARCIANDVRSWTFPEPESERVLTLPFHLIRQ